MGYYDSPDDADRYDVDPRDTADDDDACTACNGHGFIRGRECRACEGAGRLESETAKLAAGVRANRVW